MTSRLSSLFGKQSVLVTGASSGMGLEFARQTAAAGARLILVARSVDKLHSLADELRAAHGTECHVIPCDLAREGGATQLLDELAAGGIEVDHLINNAGLGRAQGVVGDAPAQLGRLVHLNCTSLTELTTGLLPAMVARKRGGVLQVASMVGFYPSPFMAAYAASKAYVLSFSEALSVELAGSGVHMSALCPGHVPTGFQVAAGFSDAAIAVPGSMSAERMVRLALAGYAANKRVVVPGFMNWLGGVFMRLLPRIWVAKIAESTLRKLKRFD